jgi:hypothetical protein
MLALGLVLLLLVAAVAALPYGLSTPRARRWLLERANRVLAPGGRLEVATFRFSWFGPTRMTGFTIRDAQGDAVVFAPRAVWDRPLGRILFDHPRLGRLALDGGHLDIERRPDGSIDVLEALEPILTPEPRIDWTIDMQNGTVRVRSPELTSPCVAQRGSVHIRRPPAPRPLSWDVLLADGDGARTLKIVGSSNRWTATPDRPGDLELTAAARRWPLGLERPEGTASATSWDGTVQLRRQAGLWATQGRAALTALAVAARGGRAVRVDSLAADWNAAQNANGWDVRTLTLNSDAGMLQVAGTTEAGRFLAHVTSDLDLGKLVVLFGGETSDWPLGLSPGTARAHLSADLVRGEASAPRSVRAEGHLALSGLVRQDGAEVPPIRASLQGHYDPEPDAIALERLSVETPDGTLRVSGRLADPLGRREADLRGAIEADWPALLDTYAPRLREQAEIALGPVAFHISGPISGDTAALPESLDAELRVPLQRAGAFGMEMGPTQLVARAERGQLRFEPIEATLNGGRLRLLPEVEAEPDWSEVLLRFAPGSGIDGAEVNDEVSRRVLAFVVPTLAEATRVNGRVSARFDRAEIPLVGPGRTLIEGNMIFDDVTFAPGPLAGELLGIVGPDGGPVLRLAQPVLLSVHDGRVYQSNLVLPLGKVARVEMDGWVDFDKNLNLDVAVPLAPGPRMVEERPVLALIASGVRPIIPVRGTLDEPRVDTEAFGRNMGRMGLDVAGRAGLGFGASLLERMTRPRTPEEQARIDEERARREAQRQERKARQEQKRLERRMRRGRG